MCAHKLKCVYAYIWVCEFVCAHVLSMYVCICVYECIVMYVCLCVYLYIINMYMYLCIHV